MKTDLFSLIRANVFRVLDLDEVFFLIKICLSAGIKISRKTSLKMISSKFMAFSVVSSRGLSGKTFTKYNCIV